VFLERKTHRESWKGEESVKERFTLKEDKVRPCWAPASASARRRRAFDGGAIGAPP
jgi:SPX domain protein involved in polyphosphate accumulation